MSARVFLAAALGGLLAASQASAYTASNGVRVDPAGGKTFTATYYRGRSADTEYWCAAGDYVIRALRLRPGTRIYRLSPPPIRNAGVKFSLDPAGAVSTGLTVFGAKDAGISASLAQVQCSASDKDDFFGR